jgi:SAM-dependent methyltransferase
MPCCTLCKGKTRLYYQDKFRRYLQCHDCNGVMLSPEFYLDAEAEKARYLSHNNDVDDKGYQEFVNPITKSIQQEFFPNSLGLDFGCGTGPVAAKQLQKNGYNINLYDPFFQNYPEHLNLKYDYIICSEVMEHFHSPWKEFVKLNSLLKSGGKLYCKTSLISEEINFKDWYYKNDPTHVFFYSKLSLEWILKNTTFQSLKIEEDLIVFSK